MQTPECPSCHYPLSGLNATGPLLPCPRCNTWIDLNSSPLLSTLVKSCATSCMSCAKQQEHANNTCNETYGLKEASAHQDVVGKLAWFVKTAFRIDQ